ncbi:chaperone modulator CbpM [Hoeflea sp. CAU 1731]
MAKKSAEAVPSELIEALTLAELCRSCSVRADWIIELVEEGILEPTGREPSAWRFTATSIRRTRTAWRLQRDLGVNRAGIAVALNLIEEREQLYMRLQRGER